MSDYLKLSLKTRLAWLKKQKQDAGRLTGWPKPSGGYYPIPKLRPEADKTNARFETSLLWWEETETLARKIVFADQVCRSIRHTGWWCDDFQDAKARGVVLSLSHGRFLAGIADPHNFDDKGMTGPCVIETGEIFSGEDAQTEAAHRADNIAKLYAEREREYQEQENARIAAEEKEAFEKQQRETELQTQYAEVWP